MGRTRKPTKTLELNGAFKKNPKRKRYNEPKGIGEIGSPPDHLNKDVRTAWEDIISQVPDGVATGSDRILVETCAYFLALLREMGTLSPGLLTQFRAMLGDLGLTPSKRANFETKPEVTKNDPFAEFFNQ